MNGLNLSAWTEEDLKSYQELEDCLTKHAKWEGNTAEMIKLHRSLVWYFKVRDKIKSSVVSNVKLTNMEQASALQQIETPKPKKSKGGE
jgi:hypothetical protein